MTRICSGKRRMKARSRFHLHTGSVTYRQRCHGTRSVHRHPFVLRKNSLGLLTYACDAITSVVTPVEHLQFCRS